MTPQQAVEIQRFLERELRRYGFQDVMDEINIRLKEHVPIEEGQNEFNPVFRLKFILENLIKVFENRSNDNYDLLLEKFNKYSSFDGNRIDSISVELFDSSKPYNLEELPSYKKIINELRSVFYMLSNEN